MLGRACRYPDVVAMLPWPKRRLHLGQRSAAVDGMRAVRVAQPVGGYSLVDAGLPGRALDHAIDGALGQVAAFAAGEDGIVGAGVAAQGQERPADDVRKEHLAHLAALAQDR